MNMKRSKFFKWAALNPGVDRFWPTGCMFDTPVVKGAHEIMSKEKKN